jgi:predicted lipoprotein with Yx(FWY)xxD motif
MKWYRMKNVQKPVTVLVAAITAAAVAASFAPAGGAAPGGSLVKSASSPFGRILVDSRGVALYDFPKDRGIVSSCYGACAALWPPLLTSGKPVAGPGVKASLLGTTKRSDGKLEVTYNRHPLYYFVSDRRPGQFRGEGLNQFGDPWWVLSPAGKEIHHV